MNKYFYVFDREEANKIKELTGQSYYAFTNSDGEKKYSFINAKFIRFAYKIVKKEKFNLYEYRINLVYMYILQD